MKKVLIVFFSQAGEVYNVGMVDVGNTEIMANNIADILKAQDHEVDLFKIEPVKPYPVEYQAVIEASQKEMMEDAKPDFKGEVPDTSKYNAIFVGYPIWWGDAPRIVYSALEKMNLKDKWVVPFNTHEGSGDAGSYNSLKEKFPTAKFLSGLAITGRAAREAGSKEHIKDWLGEIQYLLD
ncbi:flavodoxin [Candidatus Saccharibacteria bacterium]|nr:flavodoxin [Candidatus Saccharibacteria bacterium]